MSEIFKENVEFIPEEDNCFSNRRKEWGFFSEKGAYLASKKCNLR